MEVTNARFRLRCSDLDNAGPVGDPAIVEAGEITQYVHWTDVPDVTTLQLNYLAGLTAEDLQPLLDPEVTPATIQTVTKLHATQLAFVQGLLVGVLNSVQAAVLSTAVSRIQCVWVNTIQTVSCPDPEAARTSQSAAAAAAGVRNPVTILAGKFDSTVSQEDANARANLEATRQLTCLYGNDEFTLRCTDVGYAEEVPVDEEPVTPDGRSRVGYVQVAADTVFASTKEEAAALARGQAQLLLDCFYVNQSLSVNCADQSPAFAGVFLNPVEYDGQTTGNPVTVEAGQFAVGTTGDTQATADALARTTAALLLDCQFRNTRQVVRCPSVQVGDILLPPADALTEVVVDAGEVTAGSQAEADALAVQLGLLQLNCQYCNAFIPPSCYPPNYTPQPNQAIPLADVTSDWSIDVILGLTAGTVCMDDPLQVSAVAQAVAIQRVEPADAGCMYVNDAMWFGCLDVLPGNPTLPKGGYHHPNYPGNTPVPGFESLPLVEQLSPFCVPDPALGSGSYIALQAGQYPINSKDVPPGVDPKTYANEQARLYGISLLRCAFANPTMELTCNTAFTPGFDQASVAQGRGEVITVTIPRASHESVFSFNDTIRDAKISAQSQLTCRYENPDMFVRCWPEYGRTGQLPPPDATSVPSRLMYGTGTATRFWTAGTETFSEVVMLQDWQPGSLASPVFVPRGTFTSLVSQAAATQQAMDYAIASLDCIAQARDTNICNAPLLIFCGGVVEANPASPYQPGTNTPILENQSVAPGGRVRIGNGHNYVISRNPVTNAWERMDLGCSSDPVGGCGGSGLQVPPCLATAQTLEEANMLAYQIMRGQLDCSGSDGVPDLSPLDRGDEGGDEGGESVKEQPERCPLTVYERLDADGKPISGRFSVTAGMVNRNPVRINSLGGSVITNSAPPNLNIRNGFIYLGIKWQVTFSEGYLAEAAFEGAYVAKGGALPDEDPTTGFFVQRLAEIDDGKLVDNFSNCSNYTSAVRDAQSSDSDSIDMALFKA